MSRRLKSYINRSLIEWTIIAILIVLPIIIGAIYIYYFGVNVPYWDEWVVVPNYLGQIFDNKLSIYDLFIQHNESRPFFPRVLMLALALITDYNTISEMFFLYFLYITSFIIIFLMYKKDHEINKMSLIKFIPISWFFFNLIQMNNILFGVRIYQGLEILAFIFAIYLIDLSKTVDKKFFGAAISSIISTFSYVSGLSIWPVGFIQIILNDSKEKIRKIFFWIICGGLIFIIYFYGYIKPSHNPSLYPFGNHLDAIIVFLSSIGYTITRDSPLSLITGALILIITCSILLLNKKNLDIDRNAKWLSLIIYSFLVSIEITIGRAGTTDRYLLLIFFSIIGLYCLSLNTLKNRYKDSSSTDIIYKKECNYIILGVILCLLILGISTFFIIGIENGIKTKQFREEIAYYLETYKIQPDKNLQKLYPAPYGPKIIREIAPFLERYKLSVFSENNIDINILEKSSDDMLYHIDIINNKTVRLQESIVINKEKDDEIKIIGWAVDMHTNALANSVFVTIDNKTDIPARYFIDRKDVSEGFKNDNFRYSGFMVSFIPTIMENGYHNITVKIVSEDMTRYYESKQKINLVLT